jgi:NADPH:quinone reductase-like Zn-dependent oxidoreductase
MHASGRVAPAFTPAWAIEQPMKAIVQVRYGSPPDLELREVATPSVGPGDVLVRVHAASLHPVVDSTYPLSQVGEALRHLIEDAPRGKVIITPL